MEPIKRLADLTHKEILAIKQNSPEYNHLIDLECAHAGISLLPEYPGVEPSKSDIKPDGILYKIDRWGFKSINDAEDVINFMVNKGIYREETKTTLSVVTPLSEDSYYWPEIKKIAVYSETAYEQIKDSMTAVAETHKEWKNKYDEYLTVLKERKVIVEAFDKQQNYAAEIETHTDKIRKIIQRYLTLAQGQYPIAISFLKEADKQGGIHIDDADSVYYVCTSGEKHLVTTRESYQQECMSNLLGADISA